LYDGLNEATTLFVDFTISKFEAVKELHVIMLVITLVAGLLFVFKLFQPYVRSLRTQSKIIAGIMSLLPAEFDIESIVKTQVLGVRDETGRLSQHAQTGNLMNGTVLPPGTIVPTSGAPQGRIFGLGRAASSPLPALLPLASPTAAPRQQQGGGWRSNQVAPGPQADSYNRQQFTKKQQQSEQQEDDQSEQEWD
jgi:hypothetical protein